MAPRETSSDAHRCFSCRRRRRLDRMVPACLKAGCVDTCCMFDDVVVFALAPLCVRAGKVEGGLFLYICVALLSKP
jgi:hypothetical protein